MNWITIIELGAEGGSLTIRGNKSKSGEWSFKLSTDERTLMEENENAADFQSESNVVDGWDNALVMLNEKYPYWFKLYPLQIHPEFAKSICCRAISKKPYNTDEWEKFMKSQNTSTFDMPLPPEVPKIRGLNLNVISKDKRDVAEKLAKMVSADDSLDLQIRGSYLNIYYKGGNLLRVSGFSDKSRKINFHFDDKYLVLDKDKPADTSGLPTKNAGLEEWTNKKTICLLKSTMDKWFTLHPKAEREIQHETSTLHRKNDANSPWIVIDIEYAAWLHHPKTGRKLCRFDMVAVERNTLSNGHPLVLNLVEFKHGNGALSGASGVINHALDFKQFLASTDDSKAREAFIQSMQNVIQEKMSLGLLPELPFNVHNIELKALFLTKGCSVPSKYSTEACEVLSGHYTEPLFRDYESWINA